eukprot:402152-Pelagomonas_calceolata.AAC.1
MQSGEWVPGCEGGHKGAEWQGSGSVWGWRMQSGEWVPGCEDSNNVAFPLLTNLYAAGASMKLREGGREGPWADNAKWRASQGKRELSATMLTADMMRAQFYNVNGKHVGIGIYPKGQDV